MVAREKKRNSDGSDAAIIVNKNPYPNRNTILLWEEKTGRRETEDISDKSYVQYGIEMEPILRQSFQVKNPQFEVKYEENSIIKHPKYPFLFASLDGILIDKETGEMGILEIKTSSILNSMNKENWKGISVPEQYYCQILHYMNVTGYTFAYLFAELRYSEERQINKTYIIKRSDDGVKESIEYLEQKEIEFWQNYVEKDIEPPLLLPEI